MLIHSLNISSGDKAWFSNLDCEMDWKNRGTAKIDIDYDDTLASDYEQCHQAVCLGYVKPQCMDKSQLFREQYQCRGAILVKLSLNCEAKELNSRIHAE
jgi:hypothetical protein